MNAPRRLPLARADIEHYSRRYDAQKPGLGVDFVDEVQRVIDIIAENPIATVSDSAIGGGRTFGGFRMLFFNKSLFH
jgi:class 3 adenylate cyclase